jgi:hypothetical protein
MAINPEKTTCMIIGSKCKINNIGNLSLHIENSGINVYCQKLLGLHIDNCLSWKTHIDKICSKLASKISLLKRIQIFLTPEMKQLFYNANIAPTFDYGCIIWSRCNKSNLNRITKLQKRTARIILNKPVKKFS